MFGNTTPLKKLLDDNKTDAFVVVHNGQLVYERYFNGYNESEPHGMASLAKVFTGAMIQSLAEENRIDLEKTANTYIKDLKNTPFGVFFNSFIYASAVFSKSIRFSSARDCIIAPVKTFANDAMP